jgi:integrase
LTDRSRRLPAFSPFIGGTEMGVYRRGDVFYIRYRDAYGRQRRLATTATTLKQAQRLLSEKEGAVERQNLGLDAKPVQAGASGTLWELCSWWLKSKCPEPSRKTEGYRLGKHVQRTKLAEVGLAHVNADVIAAYLDAQEDEGASAGALNKLRTILHAVFAAASQPPCRWTGANPIEAVPVREVIKKQYGTLRSEEVAPMLRQVPSPWSGFFATGIYLALRKGEIAGLLKANVAMADRVVLVANSYSRDTTKGGHADALPIPPKLVPYFEAALKTPGPWMFPNLAADSAGQTMFTEDSNPEKIFRTALKKAGIVSGYEHSCRRCGHARRAGGTGGGARAAPSKFKPHAETHPDDAPRRCPNCDMKLWAEGIPRMRRFHDLRHSTATILLRDGVDLHRVQRILRHANFNTTASTYGHLVVDDLRSSLSMVGMARSATTRVVQMRQNETQTEHSESGTALEAEGTK